MIVASIHGRRGRDAQARTTRNGNAMALASVVGDANKLGEEGDGHSVSLLAFGDFTERLARCLAGEVVSTIGRLGSTFQGSNGPRKSWSLIVDGLVTTWSARPSGGKRCAADPAMQAPDGYAEARG